MNTRLSGLSRIFLIICAILIGTAITLPIWKIDLMAPQYPEGLALQIYANKLGGDVEIINGLNHYIGMKTLHTEDFVEFSVLPYIMGFFSLITLIIAIIGKRKWFVIFFYGFALFGVLAFVDFYRWNYNYGHDLDPTAAIVVPGMAYQPPVIGYKQLLNFGAYSFPDTGGLLFFGSGIIMLFILLYEKRIIPGFKPKLINLLLPFSFTFLLSCSDTKPEPLKINIDICSHCKMTIADARFGTEIITPKGRVYKFDDINCLIWHQAENAPLEGSKQYVVDFLHPHDLIDAKQAYFLSGDLVHSPMGANIAAFSSKDSAEVYMQKLNAQLIHWNEIKF